MALEEFVKKLTSVNSASNICKFSKNMLITPSNDVVTDEFGDSDHETFNNKPK